MFTVMSTSWQANFAVCYRTLQRQLDQILIIDILLQSTRSQTRCRRQSWLHKGALNYKTTQLFIQGAPKKSNPLGKIRYLWNGSKFFHQINKAYRGGFRPHILQIPLPYLLAFQNYHYLNLNVHFSK